KTPNLDRLAKEGMRFSHAFCASPICAPSRASLLTGTWPSRHQSLANPGTEGGFPIRDDLPTFSELLSDAGYSLAGVGKWGINSARTPEEFGFDVYVSDASYAAWRRAQGILDIPRKNGWFGE